MASQGRPEGQRVTINPFDLSQAISLEDWVTLLTDEENPPLGVRVKQLSKMHIDDPELDFEFAEKVVGDRDFSKQALHICNDMYLSPAEAILKDIPRAVILLGFQSVRNIVLIIAILDKALTYSDNEVLHKEIAQTITTAILAILIAQKKVNILNSEKIFSATVMNRLGRILYLLFSGSKSLIYADLLKTSHYDEELEYALAGFSLRDLGIELTKKWHLLDNLSLKKGKFDVYQLIHLSEQMVESLYFGWHSESANVVSHQLKKYLNTSLKETNQLCMEAVQRTLEILAPFHIESLLDKIPLPHEKDEEINAQPEMKIAHDCKLNMEEIKAKIETILRLGQQKGKGDLNQVLQTCLDCLSKSVQFDRVALALLTPDREMLKAKAVLEPEESNLLENFEFEILSSEGWLFQHILREQRSAWVGGKSELVLGRLRTTEINKKIGKGQFFAAPLILNGKAIGLYYADRRITHNRLDIKSYDAFVEVCNITNEVLQKINT